MAKQRYGSHGNIQTIDQEFENLYREVMWKVVVAARDPVNANEKTDANFWINATGNTINKLWVRGEGTNWKQLAFA